MTNLLKANGDDLCKEHVLQLVPKSLCEAEPGDSRDQAIASGIDTACEHLESIIEPVAQSTRTRRTNVLFGRLASYTSGHVRIGAPKGSSVASEQVSVPVPPDDQRSLLLSYLPLLTALNPKFQLTIDALIKTNYYDAPTARSVLPSSPSAGHQ